jgi:hypothetical protein
MDYTSIKVGQLPTGEISGGNFIPHEVAGVLKKATFTDLAAFIGASDAVGFRAVSVQNGGTLPTTDTQEFILVGPGTYNNVGGGSTITVTEELNALVSNGTYWFVGVEIPIDAPPGNAIWGQIIGTLSNQTDLKNILDLKADLVDGKVPASQLPSYVDDIIEVANYAALPATGETGKIYLTLDNNKIYRWSGSVYIEIAAENAVWGQIVGTLSNQTDLQTALNLRVPYTGATANVDLGTHTLSSYNLVVNHTSGSGVAAQITKGGNGEALTVVKSSGTGNAASITGGITLLSTLNLTNALADAYIASAATWNAKQNALNGTGFVKISGTTISYDNSTYALDSDVVKLTGNQTIAGLKTFSSKVNAPIFELQPNNTVGSTPNYIGQGMASNDWWKIYGNTVAFDEGEMVFELGDNASGSSIGGQRFRFFYDNTAGGTAKSPFILDYNDATFNTNGTFSGSVGIGTPSPIGKLNVLGSGTTSISISNSNAGTNSSPELTQLNFLGFEQENRARIEAIDVAGSTNGSQLRFYNANTSNVLEERMRITSGGNVGIGTTSPNGKLNISNGGAEGIEFWTATNLATNMIQSYNRSTSAWNSIEYKGLDHIFLGSATERMRITSGGDVLVGQTTVPAAFGDQQGVAIRPAGAVLAVSDGDIAGLFARRNSDGSLILFRRNTTTVGSISVTGSSTSYNTSSDYRLKEDLQPMVGALERLQQLKPINFAWKSSGERVDGFIAHELAEVIPEAVTGEKDATEEVEVTPAVLDEQGNVIEEAVFETKDVYQGIDQSKIVPLLVAAMQELKYEIELLKAK